MTGPKDDPELLRLIEARRGKPRQSSSRLPPDPPPKTALGWSIAAGVAVMITVAIVTFNSVTDSAVEDRRARAAEAREAGCDPGAAKAHVYGYTEAGLIAGQDVDVDAINLYVSPYVWAGLPPGHQKRLMATVDCAVSGGAGHVRAIRVRAGPGAPDLARAESSELHRWRLEGYAVTPRAAGRP